MNDRFSKVKVQIPYGLNKNYAFISEDVMEKVIENSKNIPLIDYRKDVCGIPIGISTKDIKKENDIFIGEFYIWDRYKISDDMKCDMSFEIIESHKEDNCVIFDKVRINSVSILKN